MLLTSKDKDTENSLELFDYFQTQIRMTVAHIIPGFTTTKLKGWLTEVKQRLSQSVSKLFKRLNIPWDVSVFVDYVFSKLTNMSGFSKVSITEETLTVTEHVSSS